MQGIQLRRCIGLEGIGLGKDCGAGAQGGRDFGCQWGCRVGGANQGFEGAYILLCSHLIAVVIITTRITLLLACILVYQFNLIFHSLVITLPSQVVGRPVYHCYPTRLHVTTYNIPHNGYPNDKIDFPQHKQHLVEICSERFHDFTSLLSVE